mgnify:CR=1 FL=1
MINYSEFPPSPALLPFVECFWTLQSHGYFFSKRELIIPGGRIEMIFNLGDPVEWMDSKDLSKTLSFSGSYLLGPRSRPFFVQQNGVIRVLGVRFRHGGLTSFISTPMSIFVNDLVQADQLFGNSINDLTSRLYEGNVDETSVNLIQDYLTNRIHNESDTRQNLRLISWVRESSTLPVNTLSERTGVHYKKLERVFSHYTGYNPKNFTRIIRFYRALREMNKKPVSLTDIGLSGGYYDQPHFIRDFKSFTGKTPSQFHAENPTIANLLLTSKHV